MIEKEQLSKGISYTLLILAFVIFIIRQGTLNGMLHFVMAIILVLSLMILLLPTINWFINNKRVN
ncbi:hypothetical protein DF185_17235 [Marinifilum breve]|uniref:Uncharacterized protein n=2 Tax=Marinifilum breve TaxID=2184082 RepID=A0A2V3ZUI5_9BACT|nr:hypothetical protein DF185_17235 [Marinifilum breve]